MQINCPICSVPTKDPMLLDAWLRYIQFRLPAWTGKDKDSRHHDITDPINQGEQMFLDWIEAYGALVHDRERHA